MQVGDGARIQGWVFRPQHWSMYDEGIGGSENGAQTMVTVELGSPACSVATAVFLGGVSSRGGCSEAWVAGSGGGKQCVSQSAAVQ